MKLNDEKYARFALCREMLETPDVMRRFDAGAVQALADRLSGASALLLTGEGSSRLFPAKRTRAEFLRASSSRVPVVEGATQALEYNLTDYGVLGVSNSGRTRELVRLFRSLGEGGHERLCGVSAHSQTPLAEVSDAYHTLICGAEEAVAATKSVVEQAMVIQALGCALEGAPFPDAAPGADAVARALTTSVPESFSGAMASARIIFFAGRNDGVGEELTLKTNEIVRKPADFLEGTYAAHGIEEIMGSDDVLILIDPFAEEEAKLAECLGRGAGVTILAVSDRETSFPTLRIPPCGLWKEYALLAAGWNLLVEAGIASGINLDKPERARKVGNEV